MEYVIEAIARDLKRSKKGEVYTGVKLVDIGWVNAMGDHHNKSKGDSIYLTQPRPIGDGKQLWAFVDKVPEPAKPPSGGPIITPVRYDSTPVRTSVSGAAKTLGEWEMFVRGAWVVAVELEPSDAQARVSLVNTAVIAWTQDKIILSGNLEPDPDDVPF